MRKLACSLATILLAASLAEASTVQQRQSGLDLLVQGQQMAFVATQSGATTTSSSALTERQGTITGRVVDADGGRGLSGAQVHVAQLELGTLSQANGEFVLTNVPAGTHTLMAERLGFRPVSQDVTVASGEIVQVTFELREQALQLDALVVTGTPGGTQARAIGNVVSTLDVSALRELAPVSTVQNLFGDRVAGMMVLGGGGDVGDDAAPIRIRGTSSTALSNDPIIYIDGIRMNSSQAHGGASSRLDDLNPADIESVEVIKGPAAATLYGTEASNGVIQIITKRGATGAAQFDAAVQFGTQWVPNPLEIAGDHYGRNANTGAFIGPTNVLLLEEQRTGSHPLQYGALQRYDLSLRGGTDLMRYYASVGHSDREGVVDWNYDNNTSVRLNLDATTHDRLSLALSASFLTREHRSAMGWFSQVWSGNPGSSELAGGHGTPLHGWFSRTPEVMRNDEIDIRATDRGSISLTASMDPFDWLATRFIVGRDVTYENREFWHPKRDPSHLIGDNRRGRKRVWQDATTLTTMDLSGTASTRLLDGRLGSATSAGFQYYDRTNHSTFTDGTNLATSTLRVAGAASVVTGSENFLQNVTVGTYVQQQFDWEERLFLTAAVRADDNSAFGANFDAAVYPKLSMTWVVSEEDFWTTERVDQFRVRGAWGKAGQQPDMFAAARLFQVHPGPQNQPTLTPMLFGNPDLAPETGQELELGFDAGLLQDRLALSFTAYWKTTNDAIVAQPLAESMGFPDAQLLNIGETKNWGTETEVDFRVLTRNHVRWDLGMAFATMRNEISDLAGAGSIPVRRGQMHVEGFPLAALFAEKVVQAEFVSGDSGPVRNLLCDGGTGPSGREQGGAPVACGDAPAVFWGAGEPTWNVSVNSTFTLFQNWRVHASVDARGGNMRYQDRIGARHTSYSSTQCANLLDDLMCSAQRSINRAPLGFHDGSFARLREVSLNYRVPGEWADRMNLSAASINFSWRNVGLLWFPGKNQAGGPNGVFPTKYSVRIPDPETTASSQAFFGESVAESPIQSQASVSVRVSF